MPKVEISGFSSNMNHSSCPWISPKLLIIVASPSPLSWVPNLFLWPRSFSCSQLYAWHFHLPFSQSPETQYARRLLESTSLFQPVYCHFLTPLGLQSLRLTITSTPHILSFVQCLLLHSPGSCSESLFLSPCHCNHSTRPHQAKPKWPQLLLLHCLLHTHPSGSDSGGLEVAWYLHD